MERLQTTPTKINYNKAYTADPELNHYLTEKNSIFDHKEMKTSHVENKSSIEPVELVKEYIHNKRTSNYIFKCELVI